MSAYQQITDSGDGAFAVVYQQTSTSAWGVQAQTYATEAEADAAAIAVVEAGAYQARVAKPTGVLFRHA
jgi:hypothetical protein